ncbi:extracellular solute-binding protein [Paenibacillus sp. Marseille-Q4541]|uniref:extracellular solute-binding protein n=1 Tax=Paenibacillus sp. Marseille-Q4541 TaxID=2831522 RepID=UPI002018BC58|nr:extracellular solute-binding protein [Paenibacillus sp. Marseille-Q4541]
MGRKGNRAIYFALVMFALFISSSCTPEEEGNKGSTMLSDVAYTSDKQFSSPDDRKLTYWAELNANVGSIKSNLAEVPFFQEWQQKTGVKLEFINPPVNQAKEALNVLLMSDNLPDLIEYEWINYPGGPEKAINDGYILRLNDPIDQYAPNFKKFLANNPEIDKQIRTADGSYYAFPFIQIEDKLRTYQGPIIRKDWLDELGLSVPSTISEWHTVLTAFKEKKGINAPLTFLGVPNLLFGIEGGAFIGAFGIKKGFYQEDGLVKFGPSEPEYKDFLSLFRDWYAEGLIDMHFSATDMETQGMNMIMGRSGASIWNAGSGIGTWLRILKEKDPAAELVAAPYPVLLKGERPKFGQKVTAVGSNSVAISTSSAHVEEAVRMLDFGYGEEGHLLFNFGKEGLSYEMKNGYPAYTDLILNNPDKLSPAQALAMYTRASYYGPFVQDTRYLDQYYALPEQQEAIQIWADTDAALYNLPSAPKTERENAELSAIMQEVNKLVDEASLKMILGIESIDTFDTYIEQLESIHIGRAIEIHQQALDRYNNETPSY